MCWMTTPSSARGSDFDDYLILGQAESLGAKLETFDKKLKKEL